MVLGQTLPMPADLSEPFRDAVGPALEPAEALCNLVLFGTFFGLVFVKKACVLGANDEPPFQARLFLMCLCTH